MSADFREAFRALLLPIDVGREDESLAAGQAALADSGIEASDQADFIRLELERAKAGGERSAALANAIGAALRAGDPTRGTRLAAKYSALHDDVLQGRHLLGFDEASAFLSQARLIAKLAAEESMSAAQIARVLSARDARVDFSWRAVRDVLAQLGEEPGLDKAKAQALFTEDEVLEELHFADADFYDAADLVGRAGAALGFPGDLRTCLIELFAPQPSVGTRHGPYLQMLHYQCVIAEFFDHPLTVVYEFSPRGDVAAWLFDQYPGDLCPAGNPFLNNAKAVDQLDIAWARSKAGLMGAALALYEILAGLEVMAFAARQELAGWLRRWLLRVIRLTRELAKKVPERPSLSEIAALFDAVARDETRTAGIIEQRIVDVVALTRHPEASGWRSHGVGDSVNASNVSRRKLGDCEFQDASARAAVAYEAHAGNLSQIYVDGHVQTLRRVLPMRLEEWQRIDDIEAWTVEVVFVAHSFSCLAVPVSIDGVEVAVTFIEYRDLISAAPTPAAIEELFALHVNGRLNERRTPQRVRDRYFELAT